jgi:hypothetical protein
MIESQKLALRYEVQLTDNTHLNDRQSPFPELWSLARHLFGDPFADVDAVPGCVNMPDPVRDCS